MARLPVTSSAWTVGTSNIVQQYLCHKVAGAYKARRTYPISSFSMLIYTIDWVRKNVFPLSLLLSQLRMVFNGNVLSGNE